METKQDLYIHILGAMKPLFFALLLVLAACAGQDEPTMEEVDGVQLSDKEITLEVDGWKPLAESRATIFETQDDFLNDASTAKGGGNFTMHAYLRETGASFIGGARAWYFVPDNATVGSWRFYDKVNNRFPQYYWPQNNSVDFYAYMPYRDSPRPKNITVGEYIQGTGLSLTCQMQQHVNLADSAGQETIFAYTTNKSKADGTVNMHFVHPFSAVNFRLKQGHRGLRIDSIRFNNVYLTGIDTLNATTDKNTKVSWTGTGDKGDFHITVKQTIPDEINFGAPIGKIEKSYLVMPQDLKNATITIYYYWDNADPNGQDDEVNGDEDTNKTNDYYQIKRSINENWIAGNKYTYVLDLGDNAAEILFKVLVEPWEVEGHKHIIDVE